MEDRPKCNKRVNSRPWWMGVDQFDPCFCVLDKNHEGLCICSHGLSK